MITNSNKLFHFLMMVTRQIWDEHRRRTWYFILLNKCIQLMTERLESELTPYRLVRWIWSLDCQVGWVCVKSTTRRCVAVCSHNCTTKQFLAQTTGASFHASTQFGTRQQLGHKATQRHPTIIVWVLNCALWRQLGGYSGSLPATVNSSNKQGGLLKDSQGKEGSRLQVNWL